MATRKLALAATAACALAIGLGATSAKAFDKVDWDWYLDVHTHIDMYFKAVGILFDPNVVVTVETDQVQVGDVSAYSKVYGVWNIQPEGEGHKEWVSLDGYVKIPVGYHDYIKLPVTVSGHVWVDGDFDANALTELPEVVSTATAVGNNASISVDPADSAVVNLHGTQELSGGGGCGFLGCHYTLADVDAVSSVSHILNASVDSAATAVGNNYSADLVTTSGLDEIMVTADVSQTSYANVSAASYVGGVTLNGYTNLGKLDVPIVSSVATAVGNNISVNIGPIDEEEDN